jgi:ABC-type nitrate/sulfonate/bicarbonate transport system substrate-binding protein
MNTGRFCKHHGGTTGGLLREREALIRRSTRFGFAGRGRQRCSVAGKLALCVMVAIATGGTSLAAWGQQPCAKVWGPVRIQEWTGDIINIVPWVADAKGIFKKHCLNVKLVPLVGGPASLTALANESLEYANGAMDSPMRARVRGVDLRITANMYGENWSVLVARSGLTLPHLTEGYPGMMQDFVGKKVGVTQLAATTEAYMRAAFEGAGLSADSATYVAVGGVATAVPALKGGTVDAAMMFGTGPELAEALGVGKIVLDFRKDVGPKQLRALRGATLSWAAYGPYIDKNQDAVAAFTAANNEAIAWIQDPANRNELYKIIGERMPLPDTLPNREATLKRIVDINAGILSPGVPKSAVDGYNNYLVKFLKQIPAPIPYDEIIWKTARLP